MADIKTEHPKPNQRVEPTRESQPESQPENPRKAIRERRERRLRVIDGPPNTVKVFAASEALREALRHANGTRFRASLGEGVEWPNDSFTKRRIADGSVRLDGPGPTEAPEVDETKNPREQAAVNKPQAATNAAQQPQSAPETERLRGTAQAPQASSSRQVPSAAPQSSE